MLNRRDVSKRLDGYLRMKNLELPYEEYEAALTTLLKCPSLQLVNRRMDFVINSIAIQTLRNRKCSGNRDTKSFDW